MQFRLLILISITVLLAKISANAQQEAVDLYASSGLGIKGETVQIEIKVNNFVDILSFQASLNWNPALLSYVGVSDFGIKDFSETNFGTSTVDEGHLRFLWEPNDALPITIVDSTLLFSASFEIISNQPQEAIINYVDVTSNPAFPVEFANKDFEIVSVDSYEGVVTIISDYKDLVNIISTPNNSCDEKVVNGSLGADVMGNKTDYSFLWYKGTEIKASPDFFGSLYQGLAAGEYTLQVQHLDGTIFVEKIDTSVLDAPTGIPDQIKLISKTSQSSCSSDPSNLTGSIEISVNDAQPVGTYEISWWKGSFEAGEELTTFRNLYKADMLDEGEYEVKVANMVTRCASYHPENVGEALVQLIAELTAQHNNFCEGAANGSVQATIATDPILDLRYYWFDESQEIDSSQALGKGQELEGLMKGNYTSWVIDLNSECSATATVSVEDELVFAEALIEQRDDTLYANTEDASWFLDGTDLQISAAYILPDKSGNYNFTIVNEFNCMSESDEIYFGVTALEDQEDHLQIYPNPFNEWIRIANTKHNIHSIHIMDAKGTVLKEINDIKDRFIDIYLTGLSNGIYFLKINEAGKSTSKKVIKKHL